MLRRACPEARKNRERRDEAISFPGGVAVGQAEAQRAAPLFRTQPLH